jgi:voltage-gated potassium channel Kch
MKVHINEFAFFLRGQARKNFKFLIFYCLFLFVMVMVYAALFTVLMDYFEGHQYSFITGIYWTIVTMSTLGYGGQSTCGSGRE